MRLVVVARSRHQLDELAAPLGDACLVSGRRSDEPGCPRPPSLRRRWRSIGRLDLLVNNAGATKRGDFLALSDSDWADGFALKFFGAMRLSRAAWPHLCSSSGTIVNIVGIGGRTGQAEFAIGGAVNAALLNLTKVLADRGVKDGVRVNAINPEASRPIGCRRGSGRLLPNITSIWVRPKKRWRARSVWRDSASPRKSRGSSPSWHRRRRRSARARLSMRMAARRERSNPSSTCRRLKTRAERSLVCRRPWDSPS